MKKKSEKVFQDLHRRVARNLARLRAEQGLTFEALAACTGLHLRHLQKIEAGESNVTLDTIAHLAKGLDVDAHELMTKPPAR
jgi:XRE family transcriptional regulator, regulator of sulfur utilization